MAVEEACGTSEPTEEAEAVVAEAMAVEEAPLVSLPESAVIAAAVSEGAAVSTKAAAAEINAQESAEAEEAASAATVEHAEDALSTEVAALARAWTSHTFELAMSAFAPVASAEVTEAEREAETKESATISQKRAAPPPTPAELKRRLDQIRAFDDEPLGAPLLHAGGESAPKRTKAGFAE